MKTIGLDGKEYKVKLNKNNEHNVNKSEGHLRCRALLKILFPNDNKFEEITIYKGLIVDFILPLRKLIIECNGVQHYRFVPFFHNNLIGFEKQKEHDLLKAEWAKMNNYKCLFLDNEDNNETWVKLILS